MPRKAAHAQAAPPPPPPAPLTRRPTRQFLLNASRDFVQGTCPGMPARDLERTVQIITGHVESVWDYEEMTQ